MIRQNTWQVANDHRNMDRDIIHKYASHLERASWFLIFFGMLTQGLLSDTSSNQVNLKMFIVVSSATAFPSYNIAIGFWGVYCAFSKHGRAVFAFIAFCFISLLLDIIFCSINGQYVIVGDTLVIIAYFLC